MERATPTTGTPGVPATRRVPSTYLRVPPSRHVTCPRQNRPPARWRLEWGREGRAQSQLRELYRPASCRALFSTTEPITEPHFRRSPETHRVTHVFTQQDRSFRSLRDPIVFVVASGHVLKRRESALYLHPPRRRRPAPGPSGSKCSPPSSSSRSKSQKNLSRPRPRMDEYQRADSRLFST